MKPESFRSFEWERNGETRQKSLYFVNLAAPPRESERGRGGGSGMIGRERRRASCDLLKPFGSIMRVCIASYSTHTEHICLPTTLFLAS